MSELGDAFKQLMRNERPSEKLLVPLLRWCSTREKDIEMCQRINTKFFSGNHKVFITEVALCNTLSHFVPYPRKSDDDTKLDFFFTDVAKFYGWTRRELKKNTNVIDIKALKEIIATNFGYDNKHRKVLGLNKLERLQKDGRKKEI